MVAPQITHEKLRILPSNRAKAKATREASVTTIGNEARNGLPMAVMAAG